MQLFFIFAPKMRKHGRYGIGNYTSEEIAPMFNDAANLKSFPYPIQLIVWIPFG